MDRITDRPDMTSAVYRGHKASTQTNKQNTVYEASQNWKLPRCVVRVCVVDINKLLHKNNNSVYFAVV